MTVQAEPEIFAFQAEVVQILDLMVHSLYSNKEIFLRELISNAADAIDRLRLERLCGDLAVAEDDAEPLRIRVSYDQDARTITVADNGIGMSREEVMENIGTIARSGTREFLRALSDDVRAGTSLIGQFGVGFYSAFIVADRVELITRRAGLPADQAVRWESDGKGDYTLHTVAREARGTTIVLTLRAGEDDLLRGYRLRSIIERYSDHISVPIVMPGEAQGEQAAEGADLPEDVTINEASALWTRPRGELTDADYHDFYRHFSGESGAPLGWVHSKVEGSYDYTLLLFIPPRAPYDLWVQQPGHGVNLHIQRVFVMADTGQLMPRYLRFIRGVIDSSDLPLNISRELLQGSRAVDHIRVHAVRKVLRLLGSIAVEDPDRYAVIWREFGAVLKEGIADDYANRDDLARLLRFTSTKSGSDEPGVSLADYVSRMKEGQEHIYYLLAPGLAAAKASPHLEAFRAGGVEVLLLGEGVDNWVVSSLQDFEGKRLQSVAQGVADLSVLTDRTQTEAREVKEQVTAECADLVARLKAILSGQAWDVRVSERLTTSPACIVANELENDVNLARRLRGTGMPSQPVLEINPGHPLVRRLSRHPADPSLPLWAHVLFGQAVLTLGARIMEPSVFAARLNELLITLAGGPADAPESTEPADAS